MIAATAIVRSGNYYHSPGESSPEAPLVVSVEGAHQLLGQPRPRHHDDRLPPRAQAGTVCEIHTSGTTGSRKVVHITDANLSHLVGRGQPGDLRPSDRIPFVSGTHYSASLLETWVPLLNGASIVVPQQPHPDLRQLAGLLRYPTTVAHLGPALANGLTDIDIDAFRDLRLLLIGGDRVSAWHLEQIHRRHPDLRIRTCYGSTETTTVVLARDVLDGSDPTGRISLGEPLSGTRVAVIRPDDDATSPAGVGELFVSGPTVAPGFAAPAHPSLPPSSFPWYATGDLVQREGQEIYHLGRTNDVANLRGRRVNLAAVRSRLEGLPPVREAAATVVERRPGDTGSGQLVAVVVADPGTTTQHLGRLAAEQADMHDSLPLPERWLLVDALPRHTNGKVDTASLIDWVEQQGLPYPSVSESSSTETGKLLVGVVSRVFRVETVDAQTSLFDLGAQSVDLMQVAAELSTRLRVEVDLADLMGAHTLGDIEQLLNRLVPSPSKGDAG